jgi:hypothetical protein
MDAGDIDQRASALLDELRADPSQPAGEVEEDGESRPAAALPAVASPADSDAAARREERRKRLDAFKLQERQSVDHKERVAFAEKEAARARAAEERLAAMSTSTFDRAVLKDPVAVMRLMEDAGVNADEVAKAISASLSDPSISASRAAREALSPELAEARSLIARQEARLAALEGERAKERESAAEARHQEMFVSHVTAQSARAPLAAALLRHDRAEFMMMAQMASERVPAGAGADALLDAVEDILDTDVRSVAQKYQAIYGPSATPTSQATQPRPGAVQPRTVSNSLASERGSIVDEEDWAHLPLNERARLLSR